MCGIFGIWANDEVPQRDLQSLLNHAEQRGRDSSGLVVFRDGAYGVHRADLRIRKLANRTDTTRATFVIGHSRLVTNGTEDNQPVMRDGLIALHNGIVTNHEEMWTDLEAERRQTIDTEIIPAYIAEHVAAGNSLEKAASAFLEHAQGIVASVVLDPVAGTVVLFSNNGSLYHGVHGGNHVISSELYPLREMGAEDIQQVREPVSFAVAATPVAPTVKEHASRTVNLVPQLILSSSEESLLEYRQLDLRRCTKCVLPETMPFISFDADGVCNYCLNYRPRNKPRDKAELFELVEKYRRPGQDDALVPFSGGRDSCYALHLIVNELGMRPITYTYDWGMITDVGRRNLSKMSAELGVENIIVAADITKKRAHITKNLAAWLKAPDLGMLSILTAGDKHFFRYIETIKKQTGIDLNLWGINPLEVTHFKAGFLGVPPDFVEERVYSHGAMKQLRYQRLRFGAMMKSPGYFNSSLWDTLSGEYYRSFTTKNDYYHVFDYWRWDEQEIDNTLLNQYGWEKAVDTSTTWRIGDGTAAFYNYAYYTLAGFTEHDTFRSNQVREGDLTRDEALRLVEEENAPRYPNLKWYLDVLGFDFPTVVRAINSAKRVYG
ncbi:hypothetical protein JOD62_002021 [Microbacterium keratanolyticum]|uniref:Glutamine--fructose-6-phosphate aminotransferase [isomerizing] n=1 Tax=Microbacterium keratanolyticum TaxID=67574 RepID=A0A9W6M8H2_9MICO|nr:hypothetical protein [Microbacterium keratanolyticum]MBM7469473.1 hypothetical protein [Microbacterium keratanolyticum]GLK01552.1 hypothetical protein GCM10017596_12670 [Microbacterium keratanolyticum]